MGFRLRRLRPAVDAARCGRATLFIFAALGLGGCVASAQDRAAGAVAASPAAFIAPLPTSGCGVAGSEGERSTFFAGGRRRFIVDLPAGYDRNRPYRLILAFHGRTGTPERVRGYYDLDEVAGATPAILVYPTARRPGWGADLDGSDGDLANFDALLAELERNYCIDRGQLFAVGHSMGGSFVNSLACARGDVLRGVGVVAGGIGSATDCRGRPAAIVLHNPSDSAVGYAQGRSELDKRLAQNGVSRVPRVLASTLSCEEYGGGAAPVAFCDLPSTRNGRGRYTHGWPPGTAETILAFFDDLTPTAPGTLTAAAEAPAAVAMAMAVPPRPTLPAAEPAPAPPVVAAAPAPAPPVVAAVAPAPVPPAPAATVMPALAIGDVPRPGLPPRGTVARTLTAAATTVPITAIGAVPRPERRPPTL